MKESDIEIVERDNNIPPEQSILVNQLDRFNCGLSIQVITDSGRDSERVLPDRFEI